MNIRHAVLCERLKARVSRGVYQHLNIPDYEAQWILPNRGFDRHEKSDYPPVDEEQMHAIEEQLGFALPAILRTLYIEDCADILEVRPLSELEAALRHSAEPRWRWKPEIVAALQQHRGTYISCHVNDELAFPDGFEELFIGQTYGDPGMELDTYTGHLYFEAPDENWGVSFCAPSIEDWLERELDATFEARLRYYPQIKLGTMINEQPSEDWKTTSIVRGETLAADRHETKRLREENLRDEGVDPVVRDARGVSHSASKNHLLIKHCGWQLQQARHQVLRQLYVLIEGLEDAQARATYESVGEEAFLQGLRPLIEAETQLAWTIDKIERGVSELFVGDRRKFDLSREK